MNLSKLQNALITVTRLPRQGMFGNHMPLSWLTGHALQFKSVFSWTLSQMQNGLLCLSFSCVTLLREALVYFYSVYSLQFTVYSLLRLGFKNTSLPMLETREIMLFKNYAPPFILQTLICFSCSHSLSRHSLSEHSFIVRSFVVRILKDRTLIVRTVILQPFIVRACIVHLSENTIVWSIFDFDGITKAERAFVFKLSLCNPFARSVGIFLRAFTRF